MAKKMVTAKKTIGDANESTELAPADTATPGTASSAADAPAAEPMVPSSVADEIVLSLQTSAGPDIRADRTLFGCFDDVETCILGLCCPCALAAKNMYRAGLDGGQGWKRLFAGLVLFVPLYLVFLHFVAFLPVPDICDEVKGTAGNKGHKVPGLVLPWEVERECTATQSLMKVAFYSLLAILLYAFIFSKFRATFQSLLGFSNDRGIVGCALYCFPMCLCFGPCALCQEGRAIKTRWIANGRQGLWHPPMRLPQPSLLTKQGSAPIWMGTQTARSNIDMERSVDPSESTGLIDESVDSTIHQHSADPSAALTPLTIAYIASTWAKTSTFQRVAGVGGCVVSLVAAVLFLVWVTTPISLHDALQAKLGSDCSVQQDGFGFECSQSLMKLADTVEMDSSIKEKIPDVSVEVTADLHEMCSMPAKLVFTAREAPSGELHTFDIELYRSLRIRFIGDSDDVLKVYAKGRISANADSLRLELGFDFCIDPPGSFFKESCKAAYFLEFDHNFGHWCDPLEQPLAVKPKQPSLDCGDHSTAVDGQCQCLDGFIEDVHAATGTDSQPICRDCGDHGQYVHGERRCECDGPADDSANGYEGDFCEFPPGLKVSGAVDGDGNSLQFDEHDVNGDYDRHETTQCNGKPVYEHSGWTGTDGNGVVIYQPTGRNDVWVITSGIHAREGSPECQDFDFDSFDSMGTNGAGGLMYVTHCISPADCAWDSIAVVATDEDESFWGR